MGSSRRRNSTRARAARSVKSVHKARRKPAPPKKPSQLRKAADVRPDVERIRRTRAGAERFRLKPRPSPEAMAARLGKRTHATEAAESLRISPTQAVREMRDGVPATALRAIRTKLELIQSSGNVFIVTGFRFGAKRGPGSVAGSLCEPRPESPVEPAAEVAMSMTG
jgi:hypothetical protein